MHVVTFYSFKGGVGRTMALANVAYELVRRGRRVLVVDFDLEAPGLPTFNLFAASVHKDGIIDYITQYLETAEAPLVEKFIAECIVQNGETGKLWVMPAGRQDSLYAARLSAIDWQELYAERDGFLLFEDMKDQWHRSLQPDYVLIDSRTGHTDVGGICTRQLPDAVVAMFFPNEQNVTGLSRVVEDIRKESEGPRERTIELHFVVSNVPELDDEEGILKSRLDRAREVLGYRQATAIIHHYNSLSLLDQALFTKERPRSRLAQEYGVLIDKIIANNLYDREGVIAYLRNLQASLAQANPEQNSSPLSGMEKKLDLVVANYPQDGEILALMAGVRERVLDPDGAVQFLNAALDSGYQKPDVFVRRAFMQRLLSQGDAAIADLKQALRSPDLDSHGAYLAVRLLSDLRPEAFRELGNISALKSLPAARKLLIADEMMTSRQSLPVAEEVLRGILASTDIAESDLRLARNQVVLSLIGQQRFAEATEMIKAVCPDPAQIDDVSTSFNFAVADWGVNKQPSPMLFERTVVLAEQKHRKGANFLQCLAIAYAVIGAPELALEQVKKSRHRLNTFPIKTFSAWRYLSVAPPEFSADLDAIERFIANPREIPLFMAEA